MVKKFFSIFSVIFFSIFIFTACSKNSQSSNKIKIVTTLFPQYDFAKQIAKDKAEVTLLLPPGTESHTYDPTPKDIIKINSSDVFLYTGKYMESWVEKLISGLDNKNLLIKDLSDGISLLKSENDHDHDSEEHDEDHHDHKHEHEHEYDPHFWLDLNLAAKMVDNIKDILCQKDPLNKEFYTKNANEYKEKLKLLDEEIINTVKDSKRKSIVFAGRFAHLYFIKRYNLDYIAAFDNCSSESEPSVKKITEIINFIKENKIPVVYYEELSEPKIANSISEATGVKSLKFGTIHNISKDQFDKGVTYLDLMRENLENLKQGLN